MGKQHELLAVESDRKGKSDKIIKETLDAFGKREGLFKGQSRSYTPKYEDGQKYPNEDVQLTSTVMDRLKYTWGCSFRIHRCWFPEGHHELCGEGQCRA